MSNKQRFKEILTKEECEQLKSYMLEKIQYLEKDSRGLFKTNEEVKEILYKFLNNDLAEKLITKIERIYREKIEIENRELLSELSKKKQSIKFTFNDEESKNEKEREIRLIKTDMLNFAIEDLSYCARAERNDVRYYKRLIEKIDNNETIQLGDGQELWCMAENKEKDHLGDSELNKSTYEKLKKYTALISSEFGDDEEVDDD